LNLRRTVILVAKFGERFNQQMDRRAVRKSAVQNCDLRLLPCQRQRSQQRASRPRGRSGKMLNEITSPHTSPEPSLSNEDSFQYHANALAAVEQPPQMKASERIVRVLPDQ